MVDVATPIKWLLRMVAVGYVFFLVAWPVSYVVVETFADGMTTLTDTLVDPAVRGALLLTAGDKGAVYVGKLAGNWLLMALVETTVLLLFTLFLNVDVAGALPGLLLVLALGTVGIAAVGTLFGAMTAHVRARELLFPVLLLPVLVPVLLAIVRSTEALLAGQPLGTVDHWLKLLVAADVIYVVAGLLTFDVLLEG